MPYMGPVTSMAMATIPARSHPGFEHLKDDGETTPARTGTVPDIPNTKALSRWYGKKALTASDSHEVPQVHYYDPAPLLSLKVLWTFSGTILKNPLLWIEQFIIMTLFAAVACFWFFNPSTTTIPTMWKAFNEKDADIRSLCAVMSSMATFLLGFFTSINVARWWRLRTDGIGNMWSASSQLVMFLSQNVTQDEQILMSVTRYARASLMLIFMKHRGYDDQLEILETRGILTVDEVDQLKKWNNNLAESIWTWTSHMLYMLYDQGLIRSEQEFVFLLDRVNKGRAGAALICSQLGTPIPMQYTHFIGLMVKIHNVGVAILMGTVMAGNVHLERHMMCLTIALRVFFLPMLYNAILFINEEIMNPFSGDFMDFPMCKYDEGIASDGRSYMEAGRNLPTWMGQWKKSESEKLGPKKMDGYGSMHGREAV